MVLGKGERITDLPEFAEGKGKAGFDEERVYFYYTPEKKLVIVPEENVLGGPKDPFGGEAMVLNVMANAVYQVTCLRPFDPNWDKRPNNIWQQYELRMVRLDDNTDKALQKLFDAAIDRKLWRGTPAVQDRAHYFTAGVVAYFDGGGLGHAPMNAARPITTREALKAYDPDLYALVDGVLAYTEHDDWRYTPYDGK